MRLIDADALGTTNRPIGKAMMFGGEYVYTQTEIDSAPTVDAVPVCRCENCVYWDAGTRRHMSNDVAEWDEAICDRFHEIGIHQDVWSVADFFCADGERKEGTSDE